MYKITIYDFLKINRKRTNLRLGWSVICLMFLTLTTMSLEAQNVNIPDANFKAYLVGNNGINTNGDSEISIEEAEAFSGTINCSFKGISDLTGIEAFVNITVLNCFNNQLTSLDLSNNTQLEHLSCGYNQLTSLDLSNNTALYYLECSNNQLTSLDLSNNTALNYLDCSYNQLTSLDVSNNTFLTTLYCAYNQLTSLDLSNNTALNYLYCSYNQLTSLNVKNGNNTNFWNFYATNNPNLVCIEVNNVYHSNTNWSNGKDSQSCFSENCVTPTFSDIPQEVVLNSSVSLLTTSDNNISGTWFPSEIVDTSNIGTQTYIFTPTDCHNTFTTEITVVEFLNLFDFDLYGFSYHPNPVNDVLRFSSNSKIENITINNLLGQEVRANLSSDKTSLDMSNLPSGNYFVKITIEGISKTIKIIKN